MKMANIYHSRDVNYDHRGFIRLKTVSRVIHKQQNLQLTVYSIDKSLNAHSDWTQRAEDSSVDGCVLRKHSKMSCFFNEAVHCPLRLV